MKNKFKHIYGPVPSWRLGKSLGVDAVSEGNYKICSFDCVYCQVGKTNNLRIARKIFVPTSEIIKEIKLLPPVKMNYITFSGAGEPTLAKNLGEIIKAVKKIRKARIAVLTNSGFMNKPDVRKDLMLADFVAAKLDAPSQELLERINKPHRAVQFQSVLEGLAKFRAGYKGKLALQIMFTDENKNSAIDLARLALKIRPDEIEINTPLRPSGAKPLSKEEIGEIKKIFSSIAGKKGIKIITVYDAKKRKTKPINFRDTVKRRGARDA